MEQQMTPISYKEIFPNVWSTNGLLEEYGRYAPAFVIYDNLMFGPGLYEAPSTEKYELAKYLGLKMIRVDWSVYRDAWGNALKTLYDTPPEDVAALFVRELSLVTLLGSENTK
jgi:hypothetical protein